jgi:HSP20 family protein
MTACAPDNQTRYRIPRVNIIDLDDTIVIEAELPGATKDDVHLHLKNGELTLAGKIPRFDRPGRVHLRERPDADFRRVFSLSNAIDSKRIDAVMNNGVLTVTLHKTEDVKPRRISIN